MADKKEIQLTIPVVVDQDRINMLVGWFATVENNVDSTVLESAIVHMNFAVALCARMAERYGVSPHNMTNAIYEYVRASRARMAASSEVPPVPAAPESSDPPVDTENN